MRNRRHLVAFEDEVRAALEEAADLGGALRAARAVLVRDDVVQFQAAAPARARARRVRGGEGHFVRFIDQGGGRLVADSPAECQKLVLVELHVSQASAAGISRCLGRDESSECLTYDLVHSWRSRGDKMLLESAEPKLHPHDAVLTNK